MIAHVHSLFLISLLNCFVESLLFRVIRYTALADNIDLDLSRVFQFSFDLFRDIPCEQYHFRIGYLLRNNHDADFSTSLNSKRFFDTLERIRDVFQLFRVFLFLHPVLLRKLHPLPERYMQSKTGALHPRDVILLC